jgi:cell wall-associated NlpC family hydrolase
MRGTELGDLQARISAVGVVAAALVLGACAGSAPQPGAAARGSHAVPAEKSYALPGDHVARLARQMIGVPYRYGGADPASGFDCSGLVYYTYTTNGYAVPRTAQDLFKAARKIALEDALTGDLVFFQDEAKLSHVGIYLGEGMFVHAPSSGDAVSVASLEGPYYRQHLVAVGRLLPSRL